VHFRSWIHHGEMSLLVDRDVVTRIQYQTSSAICTVLLAAACFPEEQAKVQMNSMRSSKVPGSSDPPFVIQVVINDLFDKAPDFR